MRWVIKCSLRHYEWWDALKLTGYYLPVIRFCHGLNYFKAAYLGNHAICCRVCVVCVRLPPLWCLSTLLSVSAFRKLFILRMHGRWGQKALVKVEDGKQCPTARIKSLHPTETRTSIQPSCMRKQTEETLAMYLTQPFAPVSNEDIKWQRGPASKPNTTSSTHAAVCWLWLCLPA